MEGLLSTGPTPSSLDSPELHKERIGLGTGDWGCDTNSMHDAFQTVFVYIEAFTANKYRNIEVRACKNCPYSTFLVLKLLWGRKDFWDPGFQVSNIRQLRIKPKMF